MTRRPTAFDLGDVRFEPDELYPEAETEEEAAIASGAVVAARPQRRGGRWLGAFFAALAGLILLAVGVGIDNLIRDLFSRSDILGWLGTALAAVALVALLVVIARELTGLLRLRQVHVIHARAVEAATADDRERALVVVRAMDGLYRRRPETARGRAALARHRNEIIDGRDLIGLAETELLLAFDDSARRMVLSSAKRVALVTAISPRALIDLLFVGSEILRLIRRLAILYGGRPGAIGFFRLARETISHLALTGGIAAGDSVIQQIVGHGVAAKLSARLGEGVVNGMLTARVGIAAIEVCRPLPFINGSPPRLADVMAALRPIGAAKDKE
jgi:putative membrane protein